MIVCVCATVSDKAISRAITDGARTFDDLQIDLGLALQCGKCESCARGLMQTALEAMGETADFGPGAACSPELHGLDCAACDPRQTPLPQPGQLKLVAWARPMRTQATAERVGAENDADANAGSRPRARAI